ncbi:MAG: hypothetical protein MI746_08050 [Pseudomonadales bacterium]|nr:hypothetical protein [Pseudomonadales bacterium]
MNWDAIGAVGEVVGAITVLVTLIYLARQVRQSNRIAIASAEIALREAANGIYKSITDESEYASLVAKLAADSSNLSPTEEQQAIAFVGLNINLWSAVTRAHDQGLITDYTLNNYVTDVDATLNMYPGSAKFFKRQTEHYKFSHGTSPIFDQLLKTLSDRGY